MSTRPCARCGTRIATDQYLCADCREERPLVSTPAAGASAEGASTTDPPTIRPVAPAGRTLWRGRPIARGMVLPSRTQYHGTMFGFIAIAVAITMAAAVLVNKGVGPFIVTQVHPSGSNGVVAVAGLVRNGGNHAGRARCVATWTNTQGGRQQSGVVQTGPIEPQRSVQVSIPLTNLVQAPDDVGIDCK